MKRNRLTALLLCVLLLCTALFGGCNLNIDLKDGSGQSSFDPLEYAKQIRDELKLSNNSESASPAASSQPSKAPSRAASSNTSTGESRAASSQSYTMADIKALKNTEHFAKNTLEHIFDGTINGKGKATGYHYNRVSDSKGEIIRGTESECDAHGVFTAKVKVSGVKKNGFSSFYPESWSPQQVVDAINEAYDDALGDKSNPHGSLWIGYSGDLEIDMYLDSNKKITTAYPIYEGD